MGRLRGEKLERADRFSDRMLDVAEVIQRQRRFARVIDQVVGAGTGVGANVYEADQAITAKDFAKTLGIVVKEANECRFWLRTIGRRGWIKSSRLSSLLDEAEQLLRVFNAMALRTRRRVAASTRRART